MKRFMIALLIIFSLMQLNVVAYGTDNSEELIVYSYEVFTDQHTYSVEELEYALQSPRDGLQQYADTIIEVCKEYNVNPIFSIAQFGVESGWGKSELFKEYNNLGGWKNGDGTYTKFDSAEECIEIVIKSLATEYMNPQHWKYCGGSTIEDIATRYCPNGGDTYVDLISEIMTTLQDKVNEYRTSVIIVE